MKIGNVSLASPYAIAPMAGMTDTAFRRLVKRQGGCGLVVTEMVSAEGLVRGIDRTLEYAEYTEEERPVSIQIFGGDPGTMADAARIVQDLGADIVDVNMGCPVPKIAKHNAGCSLMREPEHAASVIAAMAQGRHDPGDRQDAGRVERARDQRADAGEDGRGRRRGRRRRSRPDGGAVVQRIVGLGPDLRGRRGRRHPRARQRRLRRAGSDHRAARDARASAACSSDAACCGTRGFWRRRATSRRAARARARVAPRTRAVPARLHGPAALRARWTKPRASGTPPSAMRPRPTRREPPAGASGG